jgi:N-acetylmuramoyl-L-alanine amidase
VTPLDRPSPNHDSRTAGTPVDMLVLHYTGMKTAAEALARMRDPAAKVSAHYMIDEDGQVFGLVDENRRAWHAGVSYWRGHRDINARSIGIEIVNPGHEFGYRDFPARQMAALVDLARAIVARHPIPARNIVGHSDVAPARKTDPGERFDWGFLAAHGIGLWPTGGPGLLQPDLAEAQRRLSAYGYEVPQSGQNDAHIAKILEAFQRHFRPARIDGILDGETMARLDALTGLCQPT